MKIALVLPALLWIGCSNPAKAEKVPTNQLWFSQFVGGHPNYTGGQLGTRNYYLDVIGPTSIESAFIEAARNCVGASAAVAYNTYQITPEPGKYIAAKAAFWTSTRMCGVATPDLISDQFHYELNGRNQVGPVRLSIPAPTKPIEDELKKRAPGLVEPIIHIRKLTDPEVDVELRKGFLGPTLRRTIEVGGKKATIDTPLSPAGPLGGIPLVVCALFC